MFCWMFPSRLMILYKLPGLTMILYILAPGASAAPFSSLVLLPSCWWLFVFLSFSHQENWQQRTWERGWWWWKWWRGTVESTRWSGGEMKKCSYPISLSLIRITCSTTCIHLILMMFIMMRGRIPSESCFWKNLQALLLLSALSLKPENSPNL